MVQSGGRQSGESADAASAFESWIAGVTRNRFALLDDDGDDDDGAAFAETLDTVKCGSPCVAVKQPLIKKSDVHARRFFAGRFSLSDKYNQHFLAALAWIMLVVLMQVGMNERTVPSSHSLIEKSFVNESSMFSQSLLLSREPLGMATMEAEWAFNSPIVYKQHRFEIGHDSSSTQSLLLPTVPLHVGTRMEERTSSSAIGHEQYGFEPGIESGFEAMVGMMERAVCSYQPHIEAGHTSSSMQSLVLSIQPLRMTMKETVERYAKHFSFFHIMLIII